MWNSYYLLKIEYQEFLNENFLTTEYGYSTISGAFEQKGTKNVTGMSGSLGNVSLKEQGESMRKQTEEIQYSLPQTKEEIEGIEQKVNFKVEELRIKMKQLEYEFKSKVSENQLEILEHMSGLEEVEENTMVLKNQIQEILDTNEKHGKGSGDGAYYKSCTKASTAIEAPISRETYPGSQRR
ncbi:hypothetical protein AX774_g7346 [Zancudomyces culisetae]|uniref:Uncharacterized protein n=1 Tax=Zancudomyces culisetae TaxID=1213189 RepID=A0A1R1PE39_ZANCU|nr:hypothetical protein AX774_g7346 [Zancudomyces culisetae]|eukprot:OMH79244.1 hypothetical protein AX774_g7346 [Zancudomyces culisetae]